MRTKEQQSLKDKVEDYEKAIHVLEESMQELDYNEGIADNILEEMLYQHKTDSTFGKKLFAIQQSALQVKNYKDEKFEEQNEELKRRLKDLRIEQENDQEGEIWD